MPPSDRQSTLMYAPHGHMRPLHATAGALSTVHPGLVKRNVVLLGAAQQMVRMSAWAATRPGFVMVHPHPLVGPVPWNQHSRS